MTHLKNTIVAALAIWGSMPAAVLLLHYAGLPIAAETVGRLFFWVLTGGYLGY